MSGDYYQPTRDPAEVWAEQTAQNEAAVAEAMAAAADRVTILHVGDSDNGPRPAA